tara:strand:- start:981 stop:1184 length:204 start_codon:yes stop_codon:yes gene_type:complete
MQALPKKAISSIPLEVVKPKITNILQQGITIVAIPPPPFCPVCGKFITKKWCSEMIQPKECPYEKRL